ncbi:MAG: LptF/LptG family permease [Gemmatimonadetes bacterium]|nr:LptF/LptG family permease [Gemmatimonadota bacterium]
MQILTRYVIRAHLGPFLFAFTVLTGLLFLNTVARRFQDLAGKGLPWSVIAEVLVLSLPHIVALTLPMAVLVAVLYTYNEMTAANETTAMAVNGVNPLRLLVPLAGVGTILAGGMLYFNDRVLPETNHRLKNLLVDIAQKSPTFELREQVMNEIRTGDRRTKYFLQATRIDPATNRLTDVAIYDVSNPDRARTIYAQQGTMAFNRERTDLFLMLYNGVMQEGDLSDPRSFQRLFFQEQVIRVRGVGDELERQAGSEFRSDREMSIDRLSEAATERDGELESVRRESLEQSRFAVHMALGMADSARAEAVPPSVGGIGLGSVIGSGDAAEDALTRSTALRFRTFAARAYALRRQANMYRVEIHKKYAIAFACIVFVLLGAPVAVRFPSGGIGMVIAMSLLVFSIYWVGLIGGEKLADTGKVSPFWGMWAPNVVFLGFAAWALAKMGREGITPRGGGWDDVGYAVRRRLRALAGGARRLVPRRVPNRGGAGAS